MDALAAELMYLSNGGISLSEVLDMPYARARGLQSKLMELKAAELKLISPIHMLRLLGLVRST